MDTNHIFAIATIDSSFKKESNKNGKKKYITLYNSIKKCITKLELPHLWIVPSTRLLAQELSISRTTVVKAYELLSIEKLLISKPGSGFYVNFTSKKTSDFYENKISIVDCSQYPEISEKGNAFLKNSTILERESNKGIAFRPGLPPLDIFPVNQWKNLLNSYWRHVKSSGLSNATSSGLTALKNNICNYL